MHSCSKAATKIYYLQPGWLLGKERRRRVVSLVESSLWGLVSTLLQTQRLPGLSDNWDILIWRVKWVQNLELDGHSNSTDEYHVTF